MPVIQAVIFAMDKVDMEYLSRRGAVYWYSRRIPQDLKGHYGRPDLRSSLGTSDYKEAIRLRNLRNVELDEEFTRARAGASATLRHDLIEEEERGLFARWKAERLEADAAARKLNAPPSPHQEVIEEQEWAAISAVIRTTYEDAEEYRREHNPQALDYLLLDKLRENGITVAAGSVAHEKAARALAHALAAALTEAGKRKNCAWLYEVPAAIPPLLVSAPSRVLPSAGVPLMAYGKRWRHGVNRRYARRRQRRTLRRPWSGSLTSTAT
jgi:hypothetical protein